jgi:hypothetical protein
VIGQKTASLAATVRYVILKKSLPAVKFRARLYVHGAVAIKGRLFTRGTEHSFSSISLSHP